MKTKQSRYFRAFAVVALVAAASSAQAQVAPALGTLATRGVAASTFTNIGTGTSVINGSVCFTTTSGLSSATGGTVTPCPMPVSGTDQDNALATINGQTCTSIPEAGDLNTIDTGAGPGVFAPGCYTRDGAINVTLGTIVRLRGNGIFVFRSRGGAITTGANSSVILENGACAGNVFFGAAGATTTGANSIFVGTILNAAGISLGDNTQLLGRALSVRTTVTSNSSTITVPGACAAITQPSIAVTKVTNGGVGTFSFSGNNGFAAQTITTTAPGSGVTGGTQVLTSASVSTTVTEGAPLPAGFGLTSISCSGLGAGGTAIVNIAARSVTLDAAATAPGAAIACTFTNTLPAPGVVPTVTLTKISNGGTGSFSFTGSNGFAGQTITTTSSGTAASALTQSLTAAGVITTLTEGVPPAGFALSSIACSGLGAGGTQAVDLATRTVTLDAAATAAGAAIACTFTNTLAAPPPPPPPPPPPAVAAAIPTLSEWAMILLAALLAMAGFAAIRRRNSR